MTRSTTARLLPGVGVALVVVFLARHVHSFGGERFDTILSNWFQPAIFLTCGLATLSRARLTDDRGAWSLLGAGLVFYSLGSVYYNLAGVPAFPSAADALWLSLYPLAFAALAGLLRSRLAHLNEGIWLDGMIGGTVVAALVAAVVFDPVFDVAVDAGPASLARLGYPIGDLITVGVVSVVWTITGRRIDTFWTLLGSGFAVLALADSVYVVQAARGDYAPGSLLDLPYAFATMLMAASVWFAPSGRATTADPGARRVALPLTCGLTGLLLVTFALFVGLNPLATALSVLTLLAVVLRLGSTLARLNRQHLDLAVLAATDPLTGLANHRAVHERLAAELEHAEISDEPVSVIALDIDHFKVINDTYGHTEGDSALQAIARELSRQARETDLVGRVGGEEFALVLPATSGDEAQAISERCRAALARLAVQGVAISCSAGVASYPADHRDGTRLVELADGALYWAKRSGRGQTRRYDPREVILLSSREQRAQVQAVIESDDALTPVFQPIVELATGRIAGYEALTRFLNAEPVRTPDVWFAQARRCGLGGPLEAKAVATSLAVPGRPPGTFLSLNVSPAALLSAEIAAVLPEDLNDIVIELTEDELFSSDGALDAALTELRARGARIALDDAGAGYAGLQQLVRIKPEVLKLDRSLITGLGTDSSKVALLEALANFASSTGAAVCCEGIESLEELRILARVDTTYAQGFALGRPGPAWPETAPEIASHTAAELSMGMRLATGASADLDGPFTLGEVSDMLARVRTNEDMARAVALVKRLLHADEVSISRVLPDDRCVETLHSDEWVRTGERFSYDDYPTTEHVITAQVVGQLIAGDPAGDRAELALLAELRMGAVLMAPIVGRGETVGLLEIYRATARPWTAAAIDHARLLAHSLSGAVQRDVSDLPPWTPDTVAPRLRH
jgi:diguanylate cyclase (GGDEF)-like protein